MTTTRAWLELARVSNLPTVWSNVLAGWLLAGGRWEGGRLAWLLAGGSLLYTAGMILNDAVDVRFDREHRRERPIPSGRVSLAMAWGVSVVLLLSGTVMCAWGAGAHVWLTVALVAAIVAYDLYHKPWSGSVLIMGSCRTLLYLVAGSAVSGTVSWAAHPDLMAKAVALGGYIIGLSLAARRESVPGRGQPVGALVPLLALLAPLLAWAWGVHVGPGFASWLRLPWWTLALQGLLIGLFLTVVQRALRLMRTPPPQNIGRAVGLLLAGIVLVDALAVSSSAPFTSLVFAASMPLLLLWQRKIAAT